MGFILKLIGGLGPVAAIILGLGGGGALAGAGFWAWNTFIDNPQLVAVTRATADAQCRIRVLEAADAAKEAERARQEAASSAIIRAYLEAARAREEADQMAQDQMETQIAAYEADLAASGRQCLTNQADVNFLKGTGK